MHPWVGRGVLTAPARELKSGDSCKCRRGALRTRHPTHAVVWKRRSRVIRD